MRNIVNIDFITRARAGTHWGGDLKVLSAICAGTRELGHRARIIASPAQIRTADFVFLTNTVDDLRPLKNAVELLHLPYGVIPFHEDLLRYRDTAGAFQFYVERCLEGEPEFALDKLLCAPHVLAYYSGFSSKRDFVNVEVFEGAQLAIANTEEEARTIRRDCPSCRVEVVPIAPGFAEDFQTVPLTDEFLQFTGLKSGEYILQVGRISPRKNQLGSVLATRDLDIPLVFIATRTFSDDYMATFVQALMTWRKGPTWIITQNRVRGVSGNHRVLTMPGRRKLPTSMLRSAFGHAGLHLHPAFYELPGATYFESALLGIPTIASSWTTIGEYFQEPPLDDRIEYCEPHDLRAMEGLIHKKFGQKYPQEPVHPALTKTSREMAQEILALL